MEPNYNPYTTPPEGGNQNENPYRFNPYQQYQPMQQKSINWFETFSMVFSVAAILTCTCFYGSFIFGALAILFALLSRGGQMKMSSKAKFGLILGIVAIILTTVVTVGSFAWALNEYGSMEGIIQEYCNIYGLDYEEFTNELYQY